MKRINSAQRKSLADFGTTVAAAWFSAGIIAPFFAKQKSTGEIVMFVIAGISMTLMTLYFSLSLLQGEKP